MAGSDVRQLILQVDASVAVAQRNLRSLAASVDAESKGIEGSLAKVETAHARMGQSFGGTRSALLELQHVSRGAADQFAAGTPLVQIFTQHLAQLSEAGALAGGSLGKFGAFLGGPWGIALTLATVVLGKLALGHGDAKDSVEALMDKMREQAARAENNRQADDLWKHSIEGVAAAVRERLAAIKSSETAEASQADRDNLLAQSALNLALATRESTKALLEQAIAQERVAQTQSAGPGQRGELGTLGADVASSRVAALQAQLNTTDAAIASAQALLSKSRGELADQAAKLATDPAERIKKTYDDAAKSAHASFDKIKNATLAQATDLANKLVDIERRRQKAIDDLKPEKKHRGPSNTQFGREINISQAEDIVRSIGGRVTSGQRTIAEQQYLYDHARTAENPVARPNANAPHVRGNALDVAFGKGISVASLREAFDKEGVKLTKVLRETGHFHIEFSTKGADKADQTAQRGADKAVRDDNSYKQESDRADQELLAAQKALVNDTEGRAKIAEDQVRAEQARAIDAIKGQLAEGKLTAAEAKLLTGKQDAIAAQRISNIEIQKADQLANERNALSAAQQQTEVEHLQHLDALAVTSAQRRDLELKIVDAQTQILINAQQEIIDSGTASQAQKDIAAAMIERAKLAQQDAHASINRQTESPGQGYLRSLREADQQMSEQFQSIEAKGLDSLNSGIVDAIMGTKKLGDVFHDVAKQIVADLLQIAVRKAIGEPLANSLFGGSGGGSGGGGISGLLGSLSGLLGAKGPTPAYTGVGGNLFGLAGARAGGGPVSAGAPYLVGERGPEIIVPRASGVVIPNHRFGGGSGATHLTVNVSAEGAVVTSQITELVHAGVAFAIQAGAQGGEARVNRAARRTIS